MSAARDEDDPDPLDDDPFDAGELASYCDGDWPEWPAQEMLDWMPADLQARFGQRCTSVLNGDYLVIDPACEEPLVSALRAAGYVCNRDDHLLGAASGR